MSHLQVQLICSFPINAQAPEKTSEATLAWAGDDNYNSYKKTFEIFVQGGGKKDVNPTFSQDPNPAKPGAMVGIKVSNFGDYSVPPTGTAYLTIGKNTYILSLLMLRLQKKQVKLHWHGLVMIITIPIKKLSI